MEIKENGQLGQHDFFEMSRQGQRLVEKCSKRKDCNSRQQHESCKNPHFYQSAKSKVMLSEELSLHVRNFMSVTTGEAADEMYIDKLEEQQPLEIDESSDDEINEEDFKGTTYMIDRSFCQCMRQNRN